MSEIREAELQERVAALEQENAVLSRALDFAVLQLAPVAGGSPSIFHARRSKRSDLIARARKELGL